jgi:high affinity sulfate transporter 1
VSASAVATISVAGAPQSDTWITYSAALAVVAGLVYLVLGLFRMGWISNFLSSPVLEGFVFGFGIGLTIDQAHKILGTPKAEGSYVQVLIETLRDLPDTSLPTLGVGLTALGVLMVLRTAAPRLPRALIVVVLGIVASSILDLTDAGVAVVGAVPTGLPRFSFPDFSPETIGALVIGGLAVVMVGFSESLAAARAAAARHGYDIDASQEMIGQGAANIGSGVFGGYVVAGSLSKSTVADLAGQRSQLASIMNAGLILLTVVFLAGLFEALPEAVLGAVVIDAAIGLLDVAGLRRVAAAGRRDFAAYMAAMIGLLFVGVLAGVLIGAILSLVLLIAAASSSPVRRLGYLSSESAFVDIEEYPGTVEIDGVLVVDIAGPLFFADARGFRDEVIELVGSRQVHGVVIDMSPVTSLDLDGAEALARLKEDLEQRGVRLVLSRVGLREMEVLRRTSVLDEIGEESLFVSTRAAVTALGVDLA